MISHNKARNVGFIWWSKILGMEALRFLGVGGRNGYEKMRDGFDARTIYMNFTLFCRVNARYVYRRFTSFELLLFHLRLS